jgi:hypothetical protein
VFAVIEEGPIQAAWITRETAESNGVGGPMAGCRRGYRARDRSAGRERAHGAGKPRIGSQRRRPICRYETVKSVSSGLVDVLDGRGIMTPF